MDKGNTAASINRRLSAVRSLYRFALSRGFVEHDPSRGVFGPKKNLSLPYFLREEEMDRLLDPERWSDAYGDVCLRTMLMVFYETGVRLSELTGLDNASVDLANSELKVTGKRNKQRVIPFGDELRETLCTYIYKRDAEVSGVDGVEDAFPALEGTDILDQQVGIECIRMVEIELLPFLKRHIIMGLVVKVVAEQDNVIAQGVFQLVGQSGFTRSGTAGDSDDNSFHSNEPP